MVAQQDMTSFAQEIRRQVCERCIERTSRSPGECDRVCGVKLHLPELIDAIREVRSWGMGPYMANVECRVCQRCVVAGTDVCPCPMAYLLPLIVEAVEEVDLRDD